MCGFSGLPKFRQFVSPSGSAPTQARLAEHSRTASTAPRYGSAATRRPLPSIATAMAGRGPSPSAGYSAVSASGAVVPLREDEAAPAPGGSISTAASALSGRRTVREPTIESYCSNAHLREATLEDPSSATSTSAASSEPDSTAGGAGYSGVAGSA